MDVRTQKEFGDFQTPLPLAEKVCALVGQRFGSFDHVLEPTCGVGAFVQAAGNQWPNASVRGYDINSSHLAAARAALASNNANTRTELEEADFFQIDWASKMPRVGTLLLLGNPPWVTNSEVSALGGDNVPTKQNFQGHKGIAARTGKANFDISEWMLMRLMEAVRGRSVVMAMLCKTVTARKFLRHAWTNAGQVKAATVHRIDALKHFAASVDACLLITEFGSRGPAEAMLYNDLESTERPKRFGLAGKDIIADLDAYHALKRFEGQSPYRWRSGIKHDCASVMELTRVDELRFANGLGESIPLESNVVFPLLKSTALYHGRLIPERWVLVPQRRVGESTSGMELTSPNAWQYLQGHASRFAARRSSIYQKGDPFAVFGVGDYSFADWKVAISGLHRPPRFQVVAPHGGHPVMFDDTCYFVSLRSAEEAQLVARILNSPQSLAFIEVLTLPEAKRPITTDLLHRLNFRALAEAAGLLDQWIECRGLSGSEPSRSDTAQLQFAL